MKKRIKAVLLVIAVVLGIWAFNNFSIKLTRQVIASDKLSGEVRILMISDLHGYSFEKDNSRIVKKAEKEKPDLIFVLGDMYSRGRTSDIDNAVALTKSLGEIAPVCAVTGDHDTDEEYKEKLRNTENVCLLDYKTKSFDINGSRINVYGIDNVYFTPTFDLSNEFEPLDGSAVNLLLSHTPSIDSYGDFGFDCIFCGDTHGGMVRLPFLGGIYFDGYLLPKLTYGGTITDKGLYKFESTTMFVTSGLGNYPVALRFNNRPEVCTIILKGE